MTEPTRRPLWKIATGHSKDKESDFHQEMRRGQRAESWIAGEHISVGYGDFSEHLFGQSRETVKFEFTRHDRSAKEAGEFLHFVDDMKPGDLVVFRTQPGGADGGKIWIGRVGDYYLATADYRHRRSVQWLASIDRDMSDDDMEEATKIRSTLIPVNDKVQKSGINFYTTVADRFALHDQYTAPRRALGRIAEPVSADYLPPDSGPVSGFTEATTAAINLHNETQNALLAWLRLRFGREAVQTFDRALGWNAAVDLLLVEPGRVTVIEVKSLQGGNDVDQLRYGLAQTLDYMERYASDGRQVRGVLWLSSEPKDSARWRELCGRYGVHLDWRDNEERAFQR